ncbi:MAG: glycosyltransferase [Actinomycetota bacterium]
MARGDGEAAWGERPYPRVLHVIASLAVGGTEKQLVQLIRRSTCPQRHMVAVFDEPGPLADLVPNSPISIGRISRRAASVPSNLRTALTLRRLVAQQQVELVHAHLGIPEVLATVVPRRVPVIASRRGRNVGFEAHRYLKLVEGIGHRRTDLLLCNSRYLAERTQGEDLWPPAMRIIYNAVDLKEFRPAPTPPPDPPTLTMVANLKRYKGQERFLQAFGLVLGQIPTARALLVGDGPDRARLERLARSLGIERGVTFVGQVMDPRPHIAQSHIVCLTSSHEGFPNALLEAMAMQRPVVATRVGGVPELVREGVDGLLTSPEPREIASAIMAMLRDRSLRARMGVEARHRAERFEWDRAVRETEAAYREVMRGSSPGATPANSHGYL